MKILLAVLSLAVACGPPKSAMYSQAAPPALQKYDLRVFSGRHANGALVVSFLLGGKQAISSGVDDTARIWNVPSGTEAKKYSGKQFHFQSIAFSASGDLALTPAPDGSVSYWNIETGQTQRKFSGSANGLGAVALSSDGKWAAAGGQDTSIYVWDLSATAASSSRRLDVDGAVVQLAFHSSNQGISAVLGDGRLCEWTRDHAKPVRCSTAISEPASHAAFSADGHRALIGSSYGTLVLWDVDRAAEIRKLEGSQGDIVALAFSPTGNFALSGGADKTVRLWDVDAGRQISSTRATGDYVSSVAFAPDENAALFGSSDGSITLWQLK